MFIWDSRIFQKICPSRHFVLTSWVNYCELAIFIEFLIFENIIKRRKNVWIVFIFSYIFPMLQLTWKKFHILPFRSANLLGYHSGVLTSIQWPQIRTFTKYSRIHIMAVYGIEYVRTFVKLKAMYMLLLTKRYNFSIEINSLGFVFFLNLNVN